MALVIWCAGTEVSEPGFQRESLSLGNLGHWLGLRSSMTLHSTLHCCFRRLVGGQPTAVWRAKYGAQNVDPSQGAQPSPYSMRSLTGCWPLFRRAAINA